MPPKGSNKKPPPASPQTMLGSFGRDLTAAAQSADPGVGREDEIDRVADVFIRRFHDQMKLQKLESFKRFCEMLERGA